MSESSTSLPKDIPQTLLSSPLPLSMIPNQNNKTPLYPNLTSKIAAAQLHPALESLLHLLNNDLPAAHFLVRHMQGVVPTRSYDVGDSNCTNGEGEGDSSNGTNGTQGDGKGETNAPPKIEGMFLHGVLHRLEGDYENAKAWHADVSSKSAEAGSGGDVWTTVWPEGLEIATGFIDGIKTWRARFEPVYAKSHPRLAEEVGVDRDGAGGQNGKDAEYERLKELHEREMRRTWEWCKQRYGLGRWEDADGEMVDGMDGKYADMAKGQVVGGEGWRNF